VNEEEIVKGTPMGCTTQIGNFGENARLQIAIIDIIS